MKETTPNTPDSSWRNFRVYNRSLAVTDLAASVVVAILVNPPVGAILAAVTGIAFTINARRIDNHIIKP